MASNSSSLVSKPLGEGGQANVYTRWRGDQIVDVEKVYKQGYPNLSAHEVTIASRAISPYVIRMELTEQGTIIMPHYPLGDMKKVYLKETSLYKFEEQQAWTLLHDVSSGLLELSSRGICHRDLTPTNILVSADASGSIHYTITDFGLAFDLSQQPHPQYCGTHMFAAPESLAQTPTFNRRSDVFSLAVLVLYMLRRDHPYELEWYGLEPGPKAAEVRRKDFEAKYKKRGEFDEDHINTPRRTFDRSLVAMLLRMLHLDPEERISMGVVLEASSTPKQYNNNIEKLQTQLADERRLTGTNATHIADLNKQVSDLQNQIATCGKLLESAESRARASEANRRLSETRLQTAVKRAETAQIAKEDAQNGVNQLRAMWERACGRNETLGKQIDSLNQQQVESRHTINDLEKKLESSRTDAALQLAESRNREGQLENALLADKYRISDLESSLCAESTSSEELQTHLTSAEKKIDEYERRLSESASRIADLESAQTATTAELDTVRKTASELPTVLAQLEVVTKKATGLSSSLSVAKQTFTRQVTQQVFIVILFLFYIYFLNTCVFIILN